MRLFTDVRPLFSAAGISPGYDDFKDEIVVFLYETYEAALNKGKELLHQNYKSVSVGRVDEVENLH